MPAHPLSRRRTAKKLAKKTFVYFTTEERKLIEQAAALERRSVSSFIAISAIESADKVLKQKQKL